MIYFSAAVWRIVFDRYYSTLRWRYFVFCKDRPRWRQRVFDLLPSNLPSAGYFMAFSLIITLRQSLSHRWITSLRWNWGKINVLYNMIFGVFVFHSEFCTLFIFFDTRCFYVRSCVSCVLYRLLHQFNWLRDKRMRHAWSLVYTAALPFTFNTTPDFKLTKPVITHNPLIHSDTQWKRPKHHSRT